jgi:hypothetical protein
LIDDTGHGPEFAAEIEIEAERQTAADLIQLRSVQLADRINVLLHGFLLCPNGTGRTFCISVFLWNKSACVRRSAG